MKQRILGIMTVLALCLTLLPTAALAEDGVSYIDRSWDDTNQVVTSTTQSCTTYTLVESNTTTWNASWYVLNSNVTIGSRVTVSGDVHLILTDGCGLTVTGGIQVNEGSSLTIYAQSTDNMGKLTATASDGAGIGSNYGGKSGTITINGGEITATGGSHTIAQGYSYAAGGAGIGSGGGVGNAPASGMITINGGTITAKGGDGSWGAGAGIGGGGSSSTAANIVIHGGTITATAGANGAAGIGGGGHDGELEQITITGGNITATGTYKNNQNGEGNANAIGGGAGRTAADITPFQNCVITDGATNTVVFCGENGEFTLTENYNIEDGRTLRIQDGTRFVVADGVILTNNGTFVHSGTLVVNDSGAIDNRGTITHVLSEGVRVDGESHTGICGCSETVTLAHEYGAFFNQEDGTHAKKCSICGYVTPSAAHNYSTEMTDGGFRQRCNDCNAERTISVSEIVQSYAAIPNEKLSVSVTASDNQNISQLSYQWQEESEQPVNSVEPENEPPEDFGHSLNVEYSVPEGGAIAFQYTASSRVSFHYDLMGEISKNGYVDVLESETLKTVWFTDLPEGEYSLHIMIHEVEGIGFRFDSQPYWPYVAITEAIASEYTIPSYQDGDKYRVQVTLGEQTLTKEYTLTKGSNAWLTQPTITGWTVGDSANAPTYAAKYGNDTVVVEYKKADAADGTYSTEVPTAAGTYKVRVSVAAAENYTGLSTVLDLTIQDRRSDSSRPSSGSGSSSNTTTTTTKNPDGSTTTTTTNKATGTVTETTKNNDGSTTVVETKKDGTVTTNNKTANGSTGTVVTDKNGTVTKVTASVSDKAVKDAAKTGEAVTLPVEVPASTNSKDVPAVEVTLPKNSGAVKVEIPVEKVTPGTVVIIVKADGTEEVVRTSVPTANGVKLTMDSSAIVKVLDKSRGFIDVSVTHTFNNVIDFASARGIVEGYGNGTFHPAGQTSGAAAVTVVSRIMGENFYGSGSTVKAQDWAKTNGIAEGLDLSGNVTRSAFMVMLWRAAGCPEASNDALAFTDVDTLNAVERAAFAWAVENGIIGGYANGTVRPYAGITRGAMAAIAERYMTR